MSLPDADQRERAIKADRALYKKVADILLADQRNAGYIRVYYGDAPDPVTGKYNKDVMALLKAKRYAEAVSLIEADPALKERTLQDAEAANAYGIALWFTALDNKDTAKEREAQKIVEHAAAMGAETARHNLDGMNIYGPARKEYEAWKQVMEENNQ